MQMKESSVGLSLLTYTILSPMNTCPFLLACPILEDIVDDEVAVVRWAFRPQRVVRDSSDPLTFSDDYLLERYRFSGEGIRYLCGILGPKIQRRTAWSRAVTVPPIQINSIVLFI